MEWRREETRGEERKRKERERERVAMRNWKLEITNNAHQQSAFGPLDLDFPDTTHRARVPAVKPQRYPLSRSLQWDFSQLGSLGFSLR